jgi:hypothetical protein
MALEFRGKALPMEAEGFARALDQLGVKAPALWAVLAVETKGCGFLPDRRPVILFERHVFSRETGHQFDATHPAISQRTPGGYGSSGAHQYDRLGMAAALNRKAALDSTSWGIGQLMGLNARIAGHDDAEAMVRAMALSEDNQLIGMAGYIAHNHLDRALARNDWASFARGYNGPDYAVNAYDAKLAAAHQQFLVGPMPDLAIRAAQIYLTFLGLQPGPVDGVMGRLTRSALGQFLASQGLPDGGAVDNALLAHLRQAVEKLPA